MTQFAMVKHNLEQAYGTPNGSVGTVTDALSGKIQSESCGHPDIRCRAHPCHQCLTDSICCHCLYLSGGVMKARKEGVTWVCTYAHKGPDYGFTDCYRTEHETALSPTNYVLLHARVYDLMCLPSIQYWCITSIH